MQLVCPFCKEHPKQSDFSSTTSLREHIRNSHQEELEQPETPPDVMTSGACFYYSRNPQRYLEKCKPLPYETKTAEFVRELVRKRYCGRQTETLDSWENGWLLAKQRDQKRTRTSRDLDTPMASLSTKKLRNFSPPRNVTTNKDLVDRTSDINGQSPQQDYIRPSNLNENSAHETDNFQSATSSSEIDEQENFSHISTPTSVHISKPSEESGNEQESMQPSQTASSGEQNVNAQNSHAMRVLSPELEQPQTAALITQTLTSVLKDSNVTEEDVRKKAHTVLTNGYIPMLPAAHRDWESVEEESVDLGNNVKWPPKSWTSLSHDKSSDAVVYAAARLVDYPLSPVEIDTLYIHDLFNYLVLPGTQGQKMDVPAKARFYNFKTIKDIYFKKSHLSLRDQNEFVSRFGLQNVSNDILEKVRHVPLRLM